MSKITIIRTTLVAFALVIGAGLVSSSTLDASGYIVASSRSGEMECQPGGWQDCSGEAL